MGTSLMESFADPALFDTLTLGEKAAGAGITTLMGMGITFIVLTLLWGVIAIMSMAVAKVNKTEIKQEAAPKVAGAPAVAVQSGDDPQLIAVISAAIAAYESSTGLAGSNFVVRKISRVSGDATTWANAGMVDCVDSRKIY